MPKFVLMIPDQNIFPNLRPQAPRSVLRPRSRKSVWVPLTIKFELLMARSSHRLPKSHWCRRWFKLSLMTTLPVSSIFFAVRTLSRTYIIKPLDRFRSHHEREDATHAEIGVFRGGKLVTLNTIAVLVFKIFRSIVKGSRTITRQNGHC